MQILPPSIDHISGNRKLLRSAVRVSIVEGMFAQVFMSLAGTGSIFLVKFAVLFDATPLQLGILAAIGQLSLVFQPLGTILTRLLTSRKRLVIRMAAAGRILAVLFGITGLLLQPRSAIWVFLSLLLVSCILQSISANAWIGWIADIFPARIRGRFFALRSRYLLLTGLVTGYIACTFMDLFDSELSAVEKVIATHIPALFGHSLEPLRPWAFISVYSFAAVVGLIGLSILARQPERIKKIDPGRSFTLLAEPFRDKNFRWLALYGVWWMLAVGIGAPFWQPFMIQKLKMSMVDIQIYGTISVLASLSVLKTWGVIIDRFGNKTAMTIAILMSGMNAGIWVFATPETYWLTYMEAVTSGMMWAGAGIVAMNFVLAVAPKHRQQLYSGIFTALSGLAMMITMLLSGAFLPDPLTIGSRTLESEQVLFALTSLFRWSTLIPLAFIAEPRSTSLRQSFAFFLHVVKVRVVQLTARNTFYKHR
ncbi:MFS transporter [bacterium]|nr:MFS transporter [candidate division CSSED10-310 bacterium]